MKNAPVVIEQGIAPAEGPGALAQPQAVPTFAAPSAADIRARAAQLRDADLVEQFVAERASNSKNTQESYRGQLRRLAWFCRWQGLQSIRDFRHDHWETFKSYLEAPPAEHCMERSFPVEPPASVRLWSNRFCSAALPL